MDGIGSKVILSIKERQPSTASRNHKSFMNTLTSRSALTSILGHFERQRAKLQLPASPKPKIKLPLRPLNKLKPFDDLDKHEAVGMYVTRDVNGLPQSVEVAVEIESLRFPAHEDDEGSVELGNCWRLDTGYMDWLSMEEEQEAIQKFKDSYGTPYEDRD